MVHSVVCRLLDVLFIPLNQEVDRIIMESLDPHETLLKPFDHPHSWMTCEPYSSLKFEYEYAAVSFVTLCNIFELFYGVPAEYDFAEELTKQVKKMVEDRLEIAREHEMMDGQEAFNYEFEGGVTSWNQNTASPILAANGFLIVPNAIAEITGISPVLLGCT